MSREQILESIILKKQPYGEADELLTVFTREQGKVRAKAASVKFSKSKLQYSLQPLFLVRLRLTSGQLAKVIGAEVLETYKGIRELYETVAAALYAAELTLKFTPDEQKNEQLFQALADFFMFLDKASRKPDVLPAGLVKFKMCFLDSIGFAVSADHRLLNHPEPGFSYSRGGFVSDDALDYQPVQAASLEQFFALKDKPFAELLENAHAGDVAELQELLSGFIRHQLERDIKSERYLGGI